MKLSRQQQAVYDYLREHKQTTVRELLQFTNYPTSIVRDLKAKGLNILTKSIPNKNYDYYELV